MAITVLDFSSFADIYLKETLAIAKQSLTNQLLKPGRKYENSSHIQFTVPHKDG
ncbi:hypothetical protein M758_7G099400 [Ceratodon purpureus]|nr:hypothetical protein M758_7G099400 [Ceratodon purpureus]